MCLSITPCYVMVVGALRIRLWLRLRGERGMGDCVRCVVYVAFCAKLKIHSMLVAPCLSRDKGFFSGQGRRAVLPGSWRISCGASREDCEPALTFSVPVRAIINAPQEKPP